MDRLLGVCFLLGLAAILVLTMFLRNPVRLCGSEIFRTCQRLIVNFLGASLRHHPRRVHQELRCRIPALNNS